MEEELLDPVAALDNYHPTAIPDDINNVIPTILLDEQKSLVMDAANEVCDDCDSQLGKILMRLIDAIEQVILPHQAALDAVSKKITRTVNRLHGKVDNDLEAVKTAILSPIDSGIYTNQLTLESLLSASGPLTPQGNPNLAGVSSSINVDLSWVPGLIKTAKDYADKFLEVLSEIRDRIQGAPTIFKGELPDSELRYSPISKPSGGGLGLGDPDNMEV